ncbi:hypothetical protein DB347_14750 [Opitutaceae bacterium EW11]|nr:hypothetical protein DB347_14750 [Opitutaceae bacterium EW11]
MRAWLNIPLLLTATLLAIAAALPTATTALLGNDFFRFEVDVISDHQGRAQLFYDTGSGYSEANSSIQELIVSPRPTRLRFRLPRGVVRALRFDPIDGRGVVTLSRARIVGRQGGIVRAFTPTDFAPGQQIAALSIQGHSIQVTTLSDANDPILDLKLGAPVALEPGLSERISAGAPIAAAVFLTCWLVGGLLNSLSQDRARNLRAAFARHPLAALSLVSAVAIGIQCHPVIFFGKSFVSPNNGSPFLYASFPSLPGYTDSDVEDTKGSDVAALFHASLYYPSLQHQALFRDHELPLWNRYSMCGLPLLGQGQSMFGSVLNLFPLLGNGSSGWWDARYVVNRWLYAFGLGVAVWLLTRNIGAGLIIAASGPFIGYFGFRLNHMAQFSVECSPWIIVGWLLLRKSTDSLERLGALAVLFLGNWEVLNSGTVKEAYMLIATLNLAGVLFLAADDSASWRERLKRIVSATLTGVLLLLVAAPVWLIFVDALRTGASHYDRPMVWQAPAWQFAGFFDDIFYARLHPQEWHILPSINVFLAAAAGWTLLDPKRAWEQKATIAFWTIGLVAFSLAFSIVPARWIARTPVLASVYHVHNTFSCVLVVVTTILAGLGIDSAWRALNSRGWHFRCALLVTAFVVPFGVYRHTIQGWAGSSFFNGYASSLVVGVIALYLGLSAYRRSRNVGVAIVAVVGAIAVTGWRFSQYTHIRFDDYVVNPRVRVDFRAPSPVVSMMQHSLASQPFRTGGIGLNLFCGFNEMVGLESIYGVDPIRNFRYDELAVAGGVNKLLWGNPDTLKEMGGEPGQWHEDNLSVILPMQNLLNMRFYVATHQDPPATLVGLKYLGSYDLDLYESTGVWPRAFFADRAIPYDTVRDLARHVRERSGPFAAIQRSEIADLPAGLPDIRGEAKCIVPAGEYQLTNNTTAFRLDAPAAGIAVLSENYAPEDFRAYLDGQRVPYFRINHAFKAVAIPHAGRFEVRFEYWPRRMNLALALCGFGIVGSAFAALLMVRRRDSPT